MAETFKHRQNFGEQITITLSWPQILLFWLNDMRWFAAGVLVALNGWIGIVYAIALGLPLSMARHVIRYVEGLSEEARRG